MGPAAVRPIVPGEYGGANTNQIGTIPGAKSRQIVGIKRLGDMCPMANDKDQNRVRLAWQRQFVRHPCQFVGGKLDFSDVEFDADLTD